MRSNKAANAPCEYLHDPAVCKFDLPVYNMGQDENVYEAFARKGSEWTARGLHSLRRKTGGPGEMVSVAQD